MNATRPQQLRETEMDRKEILTQVNTGFRATASIFGLIKILAPLDERYAPQPNKTANDGNRTYNRWGGTPKATRMCG
jgi:hypothetical protein